MQFFSADATILKKKCPQKVEKTTPKSCSEILQMFSPIADKTAQKEEFMFQNVAYRLTIYSTEGVPSGNISNLVKCCVHFLRRFLLMH